MGKHVVIRADEVIEQDLYAFGDTVVIKGTVRGPLLAAFWIQQPAFLSPRWVGA